MSEVTSRYMTMDVLPNANHNLPMNSSEFIPLKPPLSPRRSSTLGIKSPEGKAPLKMLFNSFTLRPSDRCLLDLVPPTPACSRRSRASTLPSGMSPAIAKTSSASKSSYSWRQSQQEWCSCSSCSSKSSYKQPNGFQFVGEQLYYNARRDLDSDRRGNRSSRRKMVQGMTYDSPISIGAIFCNHQAIASDQPDETARISRKFSEGSSTEELDYLFDHRTSDSGSIYATPKPSKDESDRMSLSSYKTSIKGKLKGLPVFNRSRSFGAGSGRNTLRTNSIDESEVSLTRNIPAAWRYPISEEYLEPREISYRKPLNLKKQVDSDNAYKTAVSYRLDQPEYENISRNVVVKDSNPGEVSNFSGNDKQFSRSKSFPFVENLDVNIRPAAAHQNHIKTNFSESRGADGDIEKSHLSQNAPTRELQRKTRNHTFAKLLIDAKLSSDMSELLQLSPPPQCAILSGTPSLVGRTKLATNRPTPNDRFSDREMTNNPWNSLNRERSARFENNNYSRQRSLDESRESLSLYALFSNEFKNLSKKSESVKEKEEEIIKSATDNTISDELVGAEGVSSKKSENKKGIVEEIVKVSTENIEDIGLVVIDDESLCSRNPDNKEKNIRVKKIFEEATENIADDGLLADDVMEA